MKPLRTIDRADPYTKFKVGDLIMHRNPSRLPDNVYQIERIWMDRVPPPAMGERLMYQVLDVDDRMRAHLRVSTTDREYMRYKGSAYLRMAAPE